MLKLSYHTKLSRKGTIFLMNKSITQDMTYRQSLFEKVKLTNGGCSCYNNINAGVAELADAPDLGSGISDVQVQVLSPVPRKKPLLSTKTREVFLCVHRAHTHIPSAVRRPPRSAFCLQKQSRISQNNVVEYMHGSAKRCV